VNDETDVEIRGDEEVSAVTTCCWDEGEHDGHFVRIIKLSRVGNEWIGLRNQLGAQKVHH
jgi:hypothetical protein